MLVCVEGIQTREEKKMLTQEFFGPKAIFTISVPFDFQQKGHKAHYTYKISEKELDNGQILTFVSILTGPDNSVDYQYLGMLNRQTFNVRETRASRIPDSSFCFKVLNRVLYNIKNGTTEKIIDAGFDVLHQGKCGQCGRKLTTPESIESGIGPVCAGKLETV